MLRISYTDHVTNVEVRNRIQHDIGRHEDLITTVKRQKLSWYGHVSRSSSLAKDLLARHCEGIKLKKAKTKEVVGRQRQSMDRTALSRVPCIGLWKTDIRGGSWLRDHIGGAQAM